MERLSTRAVVAATIVLVFVMGCRQHVDQALPAAHATTDLSSLGPNKTSGRAERVAFKGIELYSWQNQSGQWCFSLLYGTNRDKSYREVTASELTLVGVTNLKKRLNALAEGESVFWLTGTADGPKDGNPPLTQPPDQVAEEVITYCRQRHITVHVTN